MKEYTKIRVSKDTNLRLTGKALKLSKKAKRRVTKMEMLETFSKTPIT